MRIKEFIKEMKSLDWMENIQKSFHTEMKEWKIYNVLIATLRGYSILTPDNVKVEIYQDGGKWVFKTTTVQEFKTLAEVKKMAIERCYLKNSKSYKVYPGKGY